MVSLLRQVLSLSLKANAANNMGAGGLGMMMADMHASAINVAKNPHMLLAMIW